MKSILPPGFIESLADHGEEAGVEEERLARMREANAGGDAVLLLELMSQIAWGVDDAGKWFRSPAGLC